MEIYTYPLFLSFHSTASLYTISYSHHLQDQDHLQPFLLIIKNLNPSISRIIQDVLVDYQKFRQLLVCAPLEPICPFEP
jgi:hypothetical protein